MPGKVLGGRYQVQDKIGTGGMATVYRGLDEVLGRTVAIKTMLPQYATDPSFAARFKQEAQAAAALQSPYIVSVYDWGKDADTYYIVMEYLRGTDLKSGIRKHGALDCKKVAQIGSQIAQALSVAHRHDIIHRDIKPQNIMVQPDGNIKVMDFGIARAKNSHLTQDNSVLGTAHYVSPEQTQGKELGPTTDIYSLGIVMYEAATGQVPFQGDDAITVALKQVNEQPKLPRQLNPSVDPALEAIILKCMQKDPAARFQTADELYRALRDYLAGRIQPVGNTTAVISAQVTKTIDGRTGALPVTGTTAMPRTERANRFRTQSATEQAAEEEAERKRKRRNKIIIGVVVALAVVAVVATAVVSLLGSSSQTQTVPNLMNLTQEQAIAEIEASDFFEVGEITEEYNDSVEAGLVIDQDPAANTEASEDTAINLTVSKGAEPVEQVEVPDLTNLTPEAAETLLEQYGLVGRVGDSQESDEIEAGRVCAQDIDEGEMVDVGTTITYHISTGAGQKVIPNVVGDSQASATSRLETLGFVVNVEYASSDTVNEGYVISVSPNANTSADAGSTVTITVSTGPEVEYAYVPYMTGQTYASAKAYLESLGFTVELASGSSESGIVMLQSAVGNQEVGTTITLTTQTQSSSSGSGSDSDSGSDSGSTENSGDDDPS